MVLVVFMLSLEQGTFLVRLARRAIECQLNGESCDLAPAQPLTRAGAFVTLRTHPERILRGCMGFFKALMRLDEAVMESAINAAFNDYRFHPVKRSELDKIVVEVSVLSEPVPLAQPPKNYFKQIIVGAHGLVIECAGRQGLLLPQVPVEFDWDAEEFLCHLCMKAGLPPDCWLDDAAKVFRFTTQVFYEKQPSGAVEEKT